MNEVSSVGLNEIGKATGTADTCNRCHLFMVQSALLDELEVEGQNGEITATGTPCWVVGRDFLLCQGRSGCFGFCGKS